MSVAIKLKTMKDLQKKCKNDSRPILGEPKNTPLVYFTPEEQEDIIEALIDYNDIGGIVFHGGIGRMRKIRKSDFGIKRN